MCSVALHRSHAGKVKRRQGGQLALRWCAAGMLEAAKQFRRVKGRPHLPAPKAAPEREVAADSVSEGCYEEDVA